MQGERVEERGQKRGQSAMMSRMPAALRSPLRGTKHCTAHTLTQLGDSPQAAALLTDLPHFPTHRATEWDLPIQLPI